MKLVKLDIEEKKIFLYRREETMGCPYKAIADDTRRKILEFLSQGETAAGDIASKFDISKPAISNHLKILKEADIVNERKVRQNRLYSLNNVEIDGMKYFLDSLVVKEKSALRAQ